MTKKQMEKDFKLLLKACERTRQLVSEETVARGCKFGCKCRLHSIFISIPSIGYIEWLKSKTKKKTKNENK